MGAEAVKSPCRSVCRLNGQGICIGCWRSIEEIAAWRTLTAADRSEVVRRAAQRAREAAVEREVQGG